MIIISSSEFKIIYHDAEKNPAKRDAIKSQEILQPK